MSFASKPSALWRVALAGGTLACACVSSSAQERPRTVHAQGRAQLVAGTAQPLAALAVEYWSAGQRFRLDLRGDAGLPQAVDFDLAFDGRQFQLVDRGSGTARRFGPASVAARAGVVLESAESQARYRIVLSSRRLPVLIERIVADKVVARLALAFRDAQVEGARFEAPAQIALTLEGRDGRPVHANAGIALAAPQLEDDGERVFALDRQQD